MSEEPTKALGRGSDTTFVPTVRAQTTEGMLEAARAEIAALKRERDEAIVEYTGQAERASSLHKKEIARHENTRVELRATKARIAQLESLLAVKDGALKRLMAASEEVDKAWHYEGNQGDGIMEDHIPQEQELQYALVEATEAFAPSDAGKRYAAMARVCGDARWIRANADIRPHSTRGAGAAGNGMTRLEVFQERLDSLDAALRELEK